MKQFFAAVFVCILMLQALSLSAFAYTAADDVKGTACLEGLVANDILEKFSGSEYTSKAWLNWESDTDDAVADSAYVLGIWAAEEIRFLPQDVLDKVRSINNGYEWCFGTDVCINVTDNFPSYYAYYFALKNYYNSNGSRSRYTYNWLCSLASEYGNPEARVRGLYEDLQPLITDFNNIIRGKR